MDIFEAMRLRHSVRSYTDEPIGCEELDLLRLLAGELNRSHGLHIQLVTDEPRAFSTLLAHYGRFRNVRNYFAMVGPKGSDLHEKLGYCGEHLVLKAQQLGLNTCWAGLTYGKVAEAVHVNDGEKFAAAISLGHGTDMGRIHKTKTREQVMALPDGSAPDWFIRGVDAALMAPTAMNQQKFRFTLLPDNRVSAKAGLGFFASMDLGIVKCHFEIAAGKENFRWA